MIKGGKGGAHTLSGIDFEKRIDLRVAFSNLPGYQVIGNDLLFKGKTVAQIYKKTEFYSKFLKGLNIPYESILSQKLLPDEAIFVVTNNTLFIIEIKFQSVSGSVDEKLQTCDFKKKQYQKLLFGTNINVEYIYILNDWFKQSQYRDVLAFIESVKCRYFFEELPFNFLGLPSPKI